MRYQAQVLRRDPASAVRQARQQGQAGVTEDQIRGQADQLEMLAGMEPAKREAYFTQLESMTPEMEAQAKSMMSGLTPEQQRNMQAMAKAAQGGGDKAFAFFQSLTDAQIDAFIAMIRSDPQKLKGMMGAHPMLQGAAGGALDKQLESVQVRRDAMRCDAGGKSESVKREGGGGGKPSGLLWPAALLTAPGTACGGGSCCCYLPLLLAAAAAAAAATCCCYLPLLLAAATCCCYLLLLLAAATAATAT